MQEWIKSYSLKELEKKEKVCFRTLKKRATEYIPIMFSNWQIKYQANKRKEKWIEAIDYTTKYIRKKDLDKYFKWVKKLNKNEKNIKSESNAGN